MSENYMAKKLFDEGAAAYLREDYRESIKLFTKALQSRHSAFEIKSIQTSDIRLLIRHKVKPEICTCLLLARPGL